MRRLKIATSRKFIWAFLYAFTLSAGACAQIKKSTGNSAYLFAYFTGNTKAEEAIYFVARCVRHAGPKLIGVKISDIDPTQQERYLAFLAKHLDAEIPAEPPPDL